MSYSPLAILRAMDLTRGVAITLVGLLASGCRRGASAPSVDASADRPTTRGDAASTAADASVVSRDAESAAAHALTEEAAMHARGLRAFHGACCVGLGGCHPVGCPNDEFSLGTPIGPDGEIVQHIARRNSPTGVPCYWALVLDDPRARGAITVRVHYDPGRGTTRAELVRSTLPERVDRCITAFVSRWETWSTDARGPSSIEVTWRFSPPDSTPAPRLRWRSRKRD
jgi:hypothetical protein